MIVKKCCAMRQFDKLLDHGDTKRFLTIYRDNLFLRSREAHEYIMHVCPPKGRRKTAVLTTMLSPPNSDGSGFDPTRRFS